MKNKYIHPTVECLYLASDRDIMDLSVNQTGYDDANDNDSKISMGSFFI